MDTEFEENDFFNYLTSKLPNRYKDVIKNCYSLCLPQNCSFEEKQLNENFVCLHILKPSPLLKSHFVTCNTKLQNLHVQFNEKDIIVRNGFNDDKPTTIPILAEQKAYNNANQAYNIYLIESPFLSTPKRTLSHELAVTNAHQTEFTTHHECANYLNSLSPNDTKNLEKRITSLFETLILLPEYIDDVRKRLKRVIDDSVIVYNRKCEPKPNISEPQILNIIVANFCVGIVYNKLSSLIQQRYEKEDNEFLRKCSMIRKKCSTPSELGAQQVFSRFTVTNEVKELLNNLQILPTPLEKVRSMHRILNEINELLKITVDKSKSPLEKRNCAIYITSDDLIATLVHVLTIVQPPKICSEMFFIDTFSYAKFENSELQYSLVTFQVAQGFIQAFSSGEENSKSSKRSQVSYMNRRPSQSGLKRQESKLDKEIDKISKLLQNSHLPNISRNTFDENLGSFLGSLADNMLTTSGNKNI